MEADDGSLERWPSGYGRSTLAERGVAAPSDEWADLRVWAHWLERNAVLVIGLVLVALSVVWRAQFLSHLYFRQDDFHLLDRAIENPIDWSQLTFIGAGHLIPGPYLTAWLIARVSLYSWPLASGVALAFAAAASLAALRLLRTLFGDRPMILIPLIIYLACPLTFPDLGIWSSALESVPLQVAIFMALNSQVRLVRTGRALHMLGAAFWIAFGLFFFEKALILPLLLFAVTAGFLSGERTWLAGARSTLVRYWPAWALYGVLAAGYALVLKVSLRTSVAQPGSPGSAGRVLTFASTLLRDTFVPGAVGGPLHWFPLSGASYSFSAPLSALAWLSWIAAALILIASIGYRAIAWRAWAILLGWIVAADMLPVIVGRVGDLGFDPVVLGLESRYVADAVPVLAICVGLAFWPVATATPATTANAASTGTFASTGTTATRRANPGGQSLRTVAAVMVGVFVLASLWSVQAYQSVTNGAVASDYLANVRLALQDAPRGTDVVDAQVPADIVLGSFGKWAYASTVIGDLERTQDHGKFTWIRRPAGTFDHLMIFGNDGRLHEAQVLGAASVPRRAGHSCWAPQNGQIRVPFYGGPSPTGSKMLRIGYLWYSQYQGLVTVSYGAMVRQVQLEPGLHGLYLPVHGGSRNVVISGFGQLKLCVGDVEAGIFEPSGIGPAIPATPAIP